MEYLSKQLVLILIHIKVDIMVTMGGDLQPGCLADRCWLVSAIHKLIHKLRKKKKKSIVLLRKEIMNKLVVDLLQQNGLGCWNVLKKSVNRGKMFPQLTNSMVLAILKSMHLVLNMFIFTRTLVTYARTIEPPLLSTSSFWVWAAPSTTPTLWSLSKNWVSILKELGSLLQAPCAFCELCC